MFADPFLFWFVRLLVGVYADAACGPWWSAAADRPWNSCLLWLDVGYIISVSPLQRLETAACLHQLSDPSHAHALSPLPPARRTQRGGRGGGGHVSCRRPQGRAAASVQVVKLGCGATIRTPYYLVTDANAVFTRSLQALDLVAQGGCLPDSGVCDLRKRVRPLAWLLPLSPASRHGLP